MGANSGTVLDIIILTSEPCTIVLISENIVGEVQFDRKVSKR